MIGRGFFAAPERTRSPVRALDETNRADVERLLDTEPITGAQVAERVAAVGLRRQVDGQILGFGTRRRLESLCWLGANVIPVHITTTAAADAFAEAVASRPRMCSSLVGEADAVLGLWQRLGCRWGPARDIRSCQPLLVTWNPPAIPADPTVRLVRPHEINALFPAAVAMYTEEVGVSPLVGDVNGDYRARVAELIRARRTYAKFASGQVVFKAELAVVTRHTAQVQGVWVAPQWRGHGIGTTAMAAVVRDALRRVAPSVSLYVNDYNHSARRVYDRCGFHRTATFATVLL